MKNQLDRDILPQLAEQISQRLGQKAGFLTLAVAGDVLSVQSENGTMTLPLPVRGGALMNALVRQAKRPASESLPESLQFGPYIFHARRSVLKRGDEEIVLTDKERDTLAALWTADQNGLDRDDLLAAVWAYAEGVETHTLETHVYRLRRKIEDDPATPRWLINQDGVYKLNR